MNGLTKEETKIITSLAIDLNTDSLRTELLDSVSYPSEVCSQDFDNPEEKFKSNLKWHEGCEVLAERQNCTLEGHYDRIAQCYSSLQKEILSRAGQGKKFNRKKAIKAINLLKNPVERDFYAKIIAADGEAGALSEEHMMGVMLTLDNRVNYFKQNLNIDDVNTAMVLTQPYQYSFFNKDKESKKYLQRVLEKDNDAGGKIKALRAYILYQNVKIKPKEKAMGVTHFYSTSLDEVKEKDLPCWRFDFSGNPPNQRCAPPPRRELPPLDFSINGVSLKAPPRPCDPPCRPSRHRFFSRGQDGANLGISPSNLYLWREY